ncbi:phosphate ABC transporter permease PstA [Microbacterium koreense]|uniref:Phosphate transport system permease protein PstA n=1 Tax=Microbacterium koreense TaxID=323761 RepID=A0ABW2ZQ44_9MICO
MATVTRGMSSSTAPTVRGRAKGGETSPRALIFLVLLWFCLLFALFFLVVLLVSIVVDGYARVDSRLFTEYPSSSPEDAGARPAILGSLWVIATTAVMTLPIGVAAAIHLEEFANKHNLVNRAVELNVQNLAAIPSVIYGMLTLAALGFFGVVNKNQVWVGALALSMLILPVIIIATREALRAVPAEIRQGSLALGATPLQTVFRNTLPAALPGIATGSILGLSRALGEAAPLLLLGGLVFLRFDPNGLMSGYTTMPIQIFNWTGRPQEGFHELAAATSIVLLVVLLSMNALAIFIRNRFQKRW